MEPEPISVVLPCYNEEETVGEVLREVTETLQRVGRPFEIVVVDDGSTDRTVDRVQASGLAHRIVRHPINRGYGAALKTGLQTARYEWVLLMDADGQHPAANILPVLERASGCDMVIGARQGAGSPLWRSPGKWLLRKLCEFLVARRIPDVNSGFRLVRRVEALRYLHLGSDRFSFTTSLTLAFLSDGRVVGFVPIEVRPRRAGRSQVRLATGMSALMLILRIVGTFNPLRIFMPPTILFFSMGIGYMAWGLWTEANVGDAAVLLIVLSAILFCFGLIADQLALLRREIARTRPPEGDLQAMHPSGRLASRRAAPAEAEVNDAPASALSSNGAHDSD